MRTRRLKLSGTIATYHVMTRTVAGAHLFGDREKEMLRKMLWQVADFAGVEVLTYCILSNHFHVLVRVDDRRVVFDQELMRRYRVLYPKPTKYQTASAELMEKTLRAGGEEAEVLRQKLRARMGDVSEFMKTLKQRFSVWYNRTYDRYGTLWAERFKSVLVEGKGNPLQTMAAYIDLNSVRAGLVEDPKDYRYGGYAEAVAGRKEARAGLLAVWSNFGSKQAETALRAHRRLLFGKRAGESGLADFSRERALKVLEDQDGRLTKAEVLRCRVRYFSDGAILGSGEFVRGFVATWQKERGRKHPPKVNRMRGVGWGDLATIQALRRQIFS